jgi:hypothetical protein
MMSRTTDMRRADRARSARDSTAMFHDVLLVVAWAGVIALFWTGTNDPLAFLAVAFNFLASYEAGRSAELHGMAAIAYDERAGTTPR